MKLADAHVIASRANPGLRERRDIANWQTPVLPAAPDTEAIEMTHIVLAGIKNGNFPCAGQAKLVFVKMRRLFRKRQMAYYKSQPFLLQFCGKSLSPGMPACTIGPSILALGDIKIRPDASPPTRALFHFSGRAVVNLTAFDKTAVPLARCASRAKS